jgi:hypothetical protein
LAVAAVVFHAVAARRTKNQGRKRDLVEEENEEEEEDKEDEEEEEEVATAWDGNDKHGDEVIDCKKYDIEEDHIPWSSGLITRLLEITHGQWLYQNYIVHDPVSGTIATERKEELLLEIEHQRKLGDVGLLEEDKYLAKVNLEEMESSLGERQH